MKISILLIFGVADVYGFGLRGVLPIKFSNFSNISLKVKRSDDAAIIELPLGLDQVSSSSLPQENFFQYANGNYLDMIQKDYPNKEWSLLRSLTARHYSLVDSMVEEAAAIPGNNSIGDLYLSGINEEVIENAGLDPIKDLLVGAQGITSKDDLIPFIAKLHKEGYDSILFQVGPLKDIISSGQTITAIHEGSFLGYPGMTYENVIIHLQQLFELFGMDEPEKNARDVFNIDLYFYDFQEAINDRRNSENQFKLITYEELKALCPINWDVYFETAGLQHISLQNVIINNSKFFAAISDAIETFDIQNWRLYLISHILQNSAKYLSNKFANAHYEALGYGSNYLKSSRKESVLIEVSHHLNTLVGKRYVVTYFSPDTKQQATVMVKFLKEALRERLGWLEKSTREKALEKLEKMTVIVGYPDKWEDFSDLHLDHKLPYFTNIRKIKSKQRDLDIDMINKRKDVCKGEKGPYLELDAVYNILCNQMTISAAYIQALFFMPVGDSNAMQAAVNFGILGSVIGHELTHGYDDNGRKHDGNGMLVNWWTEDDEKRFKEKAETVVNQYQGLKLIQNELNGELTLRENLADLGGVKLAFSAFQKWMKKYGRPADIEGFSPEQIFFISYAQIYSEVTLRDFSPYDTHSPRIFRVNVPLSNMQEFYDAFGAPNSSQGMYRNETSRVQIW